MEKRITIVKAFLLSTTMLFLLTACPQTASNVGLGNDEADFTINATSYDFETVSIDNTISHAFTISNTNDSALKITDIRFSGGDLDDFSITNAGEITEVNPLIIGTGSEQDIEVSFTPTSEGEKTFSFVIYSNQGNKLVTVTGTGSTLATPYITMKIDNTTYKSGTKYTTNTVYMDTEETADEQDEVKIVTLEIYNEGTSNLNVTNMSFSGLNSNEFSINSTTNTIYAGSSKTFTISITPLSTGTKQAYLTIESNYRDENWQTKDLDDKKIYFTTTVNEDGEVTITDSNFNNYLIANNDIDTTDDDIIMMSEAASIDVTTLSVNNMVISDLTGIEAFTNLTNLNCSSNNLTALDVSANTKLTYLYCSSNNLTALDVSANTKLTDLYCSSNNLTALDVSANTKLTDLNCSYNSLTALDVSANTKLTDLNCSYNSLTALDVSANTELTNLNCSYNDSLYIIVVNKNQIDAIPSTWSKDNSTVYSLVDNFIVTAVVPSEIVSKKGETDSASLNIKNPTDSAITITIATTDTTGTFAITESEKMIYPGDTESFTINFTPDTVGTQSTTISIKNDNDDTYEFELQGTCAITFPDTNFSDVLIADDNIDTNTDGYITEEEAEAINTLSVNNMVISDLTGIEAFTNLTNLNCSSNNLTALDVSANTKLTNLTCSSNNLTALDVSANTELTDLNCSSDNLTALDVSANTKLTNLTCHNNNLTALDVSANTELTDLYCSDNSLTALDLSANTKLTNLDCSSCASLISLDCSNTDLASFTVSGCSALKTIDCTNSMLLTNISSIKSSTNLTTLTLKNCLALSAIDVSGIATLTTLNCQNCNSLTSIDCSGCSALTTLNCTSCEVLDDLTCGATALLAIDVSDCSDSLNVDCATTSAGSFTITVSADQTTTGWTLPAGATVIKI